MAAQALLSGPRVVPWVATFHSQQCVEKAVKAYLVWRQIDYPFIHHIGELLEVCGEPMKSTPALVRAISLTKFAVGSRYPGFDATLEEAKQAVVIAKAALESVQALLVSEGARL